MIYFSIVSDLKFWKFEKKKKKKKEEKRKKKEQFLKKYIDSQLLRFW